MATYKTPGVYVQEISLFPPSVAEVATAIPAFIGYTEFASYKGRSLLNVPTRISSQLEFRELFGSNPQWSATVKLTPQNNPDTVTITPLYNLFKAIQLFYANGGGDCYIVSVGGYATTAPYVDKQKLIDGLTKLEKEDEPTLLLFPDAVNLTGTGLYDVQKAALAQCNKLGDRFCILDLLESKVGDDNFKWETGIKEFRNNIGVNYLKYGAAYTPHLNTSIDINFAYADIKLKNSADADTSLSAVLTAKGEDTKIITKIVNTPIDLKKVTDFVKDPTDFNKKTATELWTPIAAAAANKAQITAKLTFIHTLIVKLDALRTSTLVKEEKIQLDMLLAKGGAVNGVATKLRQYDADYYDDTPITPNDIGLVYAATAPFSTFFESPVVPVVVNAPNAAANIYAAGGVAGATDVDRAANANVSLQALFDELNAIINGLSYSTSFIKDPTGVGSPQTATQLWIPIATAASDKAQITNKLTLIRTLIIKLDALRNSISVKEMKDQLDALLKKGGVVGDVATKLRQYDVDYYDDTPITPNDIGLVYAGTAPFSTFFENPTVAFVANAPTVAANIYAAGGAAGATADARATNAAVSLNALFDELDGIINGLSSLNSSSDAIPNLEKALLATSPTYANIVQAIREKAGVLPPSAAIAGVYTAVDADRGVWKAPANVSLNYVVTPSVSIDQFEQEDLNVDANGGKSINAIRAFTGRGTLVWGSRTLLGNDNEWRYIPVRRFFNMVEESIKKSTDWAVFEPNDSKTWGKVKGMIDNYLYQKWLDGALAGARPDDAYFVKIGLGLTMTPQDILEGRMLVEIGMAVVRPAEFIILKFSHKLQRS